MADWQSIKREYITASQKPSYRKLAEKYGLDKNTIWKKVKDEDWDEQRRQHIDDVETKILMSDIKQKVSSAEKLNEATELLLENVVAMMRGRDPEEMNAQEMKHISGVLKDVKEILMIKSPKDLEEQDARIAKLRREAEKEEDNNTEVVITFGSGGKKEWAE